MKTFILAGGNPPLSERVLERILDNDKRQTKIVILTLKRKGWKEYIDEKFVKTIKSFSRCSFEIVLGDQENEDSIIRKIKESDLLIIGGGDTEKYQEVYCTLKIKEAILNEYNMGVPIIGLSAGAIIMGENIYISPNDNSKMIPIYRRGIGIYKEFLIGVHYSTWNDRENLLKAKVHFGALSTYGIDDDSYIVYKENFGYEFIGTVHMI